MVAFLETLRLPDGRMAGQPFRLLDVQKDLIRAVYARDEQDAKRL